MKHNKNLKLFNRVNLLIIFLSAVLTRPAKGIDQIEIKLKTELAENRKSGRLIDHIWMPKMYWTS